MQQRAVIDAAARHPQLPPRLSRAHCRTPVPLPCVLPRAVPAVDGAGTGTGAAGAAVAGCRPAAGTARRVRLALIDVHRVGAVAATVLVGFAVAVTDRGDGERRRRCLP
eukprot:364927-Chlamydomonas_euryale.AAC.8